VQKISHHSDFGISVLALGEWQSIGILKYFASKPKYTQLEKFV